MRTKRRTEKIYVVVYACFSAFSGDLYTEEKVSYSKAIAQKYFNDYVTDVADYAGNRNIETENINKSVFDYEGKDVDGDIFHIKISEFKVPIQKK